MTTSNRTPACLTFYCPFMIPDQNTVSGEILPKCDVHQNPPVHNPQKHLGWKLQVWPCQLSSSSPPRRWRARSESATTSPSIRVRASAFLETSPTDCKEIKYLQIRSYSFLAGTGRKQLQSGVTPQWSVWGWMRRPLLSWFLALKTPTAVKHGPQRMACKIITTTLKARLINTFLTKGSPRVTWRTVATPHFAFSMAPK